jgi:sugar fermentation stimulation protein A
MNDQTHTRCGNCEVFDSGLYVFLMRLRTADFIQVGALGRFHFAAGWYLYVGSASRALHKRVERHWSLKKKVRWHMDYLSTALDSEPVGAVLVPADAGLTECELNRLVQYQIGGTVLAPGFGASDCRAGCPAHLWFSQMPVSLLAVAQVHPRAAVLLPGAGIWEPAPLELDPSE